MTTGGDGGNARATVQVSGNFFGLSTPTFTGNGSAGTEASDATNASGGTARILESVVLHNLNVGDTFPVGFGGGGGGGGNLHHANPLPDGWDNDVAGGAGGRGGGALFLQVGSVRLAANLVLTADGESGGNGSPVGASASGGGGGGGGGSVVVLYRKQDGVGSLSLSAAAGGGGSGGLSTYNGGDGGAGGAGSTLARRV